MAKLTDRYLEALGQEALERQTKLAQERFICCGMPKETGHHEMCHLRPPDETHEIGEGQTSLL